jgi:hypothetical protein
MANGPGERRLYYKKKTMATNVTPESNSFYIKSIKRLPMEHSPRGATRVARPCPFGHMQRATRVPPRGEHAAFDL